jgi:hypothetical protein
MHMVTNSRLKMQIYVTNNQVLKTIPGLYLKKVASDNKRSFNNIYI